MNPKGLVEAASILIKDGFDVFPYCTEDLGVAMRLVDAGCKVVMPWASPIGSAKGIVNRDALKLLLKECPAISGITFRVHGESGVAEGNYPMDFLCLLEKRFRTEAAAIKAAERLKKRGVNRLAAVRIFAPEFFVNDA